MYSGIAVAPILPKNPVPSQDSTDPLLKTESGLSFGERNGLRRKLKDCSISARLSPQMMRLYGDLKPFPEKTIMRLKMEDATSDVEAVIHRTICAAYMLFEIMLHVVELDGIQTVEEMILLFPLDLLSSSRKEKIGMVLVRPFFCLIYPTICLLLIERWCKSMPFLSRTTKYTGQVRIKMSK